MEHDGAEAQGAGLEAMQRTAAKRGRDYEKSAAGAAAAPGSAAYQDYSRRAFYKEFVKVRGGGGGMPGSRRDGAISTRRATLRSTRVQHGPGPARHSRRRLLLTAHPAPCCAQVAEASDVIIQVLDARDPLGCRCADVERFVRKLDPSKKVILLLNKIGEPGGGSRACARVWWWWCVCVRGAAGWAAGGATHAASQRWMSPHTPPARARGHTRTCG